MAKLVAKLNQLSLIELFHVFRAIDTGKSFPGVISIEVFNKDVNKD